ncbi:MAG: SiaB family protein kinase [Gallionella sp.]|nr:SiaB family protein kinase [Gallionella sp.]
MEMNHFFDYQETVNDNGIFLTFSGLFTQEFIIKLGDALKSKLSIFSVDRSLELKVFSLVVEQSQNIIFYSAEKSVQISEQHENMGVGTITVGFKDNHFFVFCGNRIANQKVDKLRQKLTLLQKMNKDELKEYYKAQRRITPDTESKGAGLGFIEMARKVSQTIEFDFFKLDEQYSYFSIKAVI